MKEEMQFHEAANIFPLDDEHLDQLVKDIKEHGQRETIRLLDGKILDGRRRWMACRMAGIVPTTEDVETDDPVAYVLSLNLHRRHLTPSQLAACANRARALYDRAAKERQDEGRKHSHESRKGLVPVNFPEPNKGDARDQVAKAFGISGRTVDFARKVQEHGIPELVQAVDEGRMAVSTAAILATEPEEVQRRECANPKRNRKYTPGPGGAGEPISRQEPDQEEPKPKRNGKPPVGVILANEALNVLMRIPKNDPLRKRGFQIVVDWIRTNS